MNRDGKARVVSELTEKFQSAAAVFLADYRGLKVSEITTIRQELSKVQARMQVVKNRLMKRALDADESKQLSEHLKGPIAVTFVEEDAVGAAKVLAKYADEFEPLEVRVGFMRKEVIGHEQIKALSKLPSKEELYAKLLGTLMAPASNLVRALQGTSTQIVRALAAIRDSKQGNS